MIHAPEEQRLVGLPVGPQPTTRVTTVSRVLDALPRGSGCKLRRRSAVEAALGCWPLPVSGCDWIS